MKWLKTVLVRRCDAGFSQCFNINLNFYWAVEVKYIKQPTLNADTLLLSISWRPLHSPISSIWSPIEAEVTLDAIGELIFVLKSGKLSTPADLSHYHWNAGSATQAGI